MELKKLVKGLPVIVKGSDEIIIQGITDNSKQVASGFLFIAKKGSTHDGTKFIPDAIKAGAIAILTDCYDASYTCAQVICHNVSEIEESLVNRFYDFPTGKLFLVGVTGTNGKTTTAYLIRHLLINLSLKKVTLCASEAKSNRRGQTPGLTEEHHCQEGKGDEKDRFDTAKPAECHLFEAQVNNPCGLVGTVEWIVGDKILPSTHTTPSLITLTQLLHDMVSYKCHSAVMEVSSHALTQGRVRSIPFDVAVFTNLTLDHLDYHATMENYAEAKAKLFTGLPRSGWAIFNCDDPWHTHMLKNCQAQRLSYGFSERADLFASQVILTSQGMEFVVKFQEKILKVTSPLIGRFNVYNLLAAIAVGICNHLPFEKIVEALSTFKTVPGRLERIPNLKGLNIFVDYAHTPDALKNVLQTLQEFRSGKIITVFGCGGNRDVTKRPKMALIAEKFSDSVIVTTDNPRQENPQEIIRQITDGFTQKDCFKIIPDRKEAIEKAISIATKKDIILIAGKGHETTQIFSHQTTFFDDREVARQATI